MISIIEDRSDKRWLTALRRLLQDMPETFHVGTMHADLITGRVSVLVISSLSNEAEYEITIKKRI